MKSLRQALDILDGIRQEERQKLFEMQERDAMPSLFAPRPEETEAQKARINQLDQAIEHLRCV